MLPYILLAIPLLLSAAVWRGIAARGRGGRAPIPLARRRPVPWGGPEVLVIVLMTTFLPMVIAKTVERITGRPIIAAADNEAVKKENEKENEKDAKKPAAQAGEKNAAEEERLKTAHPAELLLRSGDPGTIALVVLVAVVVAPAFEEFYFRVVLQGWLEAIWRRKRRAQSKRRGLPGGAVPAAWAPLLLPAIYFAMVHFRAGHEPLTVDAIRTMILVQVAAELLTLALGLVVLRFAAGASAADLGWQPRKLAADARLALIALAAVVPPLLFVQAGLVKLVERFNLDVAPDPLPLFFLALTFGYLYQRTHRIAPSLVLHALFNATGVAMFFLQPR